MSGAATPDRPGNPGPAGTPAPARTPDRPSAAAAEPTGLAPFPRSPAVHMLHHDVARLRMIEDQRLARRARLARALRAQRRAEVAARRAERAAARLAEAEQQLLLVRA